MNQETLDKYAQLAIEGYKELFIIEFEGRAFICKPLSYYEYQLCLNIEDNVGSPESNEALLKMTVVDPKRPELEDWIDNAIAAWPDQLADQILDESAFKRQEDIYHVYVDARERVGTNFMNLVQIYICTAFKSIDPRDIDKMSIKEIMDLLVKAEEIIQQPLNIEAVLGLAEPDETPGYPVPPGMESTEFDPFSKEFMLNNDDSDSIPESAFG